MVQLTSPTAVEKTEAYLNTSHVMVQHESLGIQSTSQSKFKYISCYGSASYHQSFL